MSSQTKGSKNSVNNTIQRVSHAFTVRHTVAWEEERIYYERSVRPIVKMQLQLKSNFTLTLGIH